MLILSGFTESPQHVRPAPISAMQISKGQVRWEGIARRQAGTFCMHPNGRTRQFWTQAPSAASM
ncbi:hypothetical protein QP411_00640 [Pseudoglutamicibacter cumminsii]|uniref:hypothetical protein n=1 Tax=Pseudoglutamicibacter cumminsii TaxID=156979 RepID=UPI001957CB9B|nr:hypothetical protein [Pseudoglutamicibacter cumminsii]MBM7795070.1 hypothetical protein [Pseudoglutamicibacter cumminsii]MDK7082437.1 hypothetical protein [Pseudoglutamicibacter cumminsii]